ncbi:TPA: hypothetical protein BOS_4637 [Bos taurus]|nr:TPA: hypothetical protein BOS_4637 [Bos taurus]
MALPVFRNRLSIYPAFRVSTLFGRFPSRRAGGRSRKTRVARPGRLDPCSPAPRVQIPGLRTPGPPGSRSPAPRTAALRSVPLEPLSAQTCCVLALGGCTLAPAGVRGDPAVARLRLRPRGHLAQVTSLSWGLHTGGQVCAPPSSRCRPALKRNTQRRPGLMSSLRKEGT